MSRTPQSLRLEIATLEAQLLDQERYHVEQVSMLENEQSLLGCELFLQSVIKVLQKQSRLVR